MVAGPPRRTDRGDARRQRRPPGALLLVTAAFACVLCLGGGGLALSGVLPQPARPMFTHGGNAAVRQDTNPGQAGATEPAMTTGPASPPASSTSPALPGSSTT